GGGGGDEDAVARGGAAHAAAPAGAAGGGGGPGAAPPDDAARHPVGAGEPPVAAPAGHQWKRREPVDGDIRPGPAEEVGPARALAPEEAPEHEPEAAGQPGEDHGVPAGTEALGAERTRRAGEGRGPP